jgi:hypothetical protein
MSIRLPFYGRLIAISFFIRVEELFLSLYDVLALCRTIIIQAQFYQLGLNCENCYKQISL